jgi:hypothetical protein
VSDLALHLRAVLRGMCALEPDQLMALEAAVEEERSQRGIEDHAGVQESLVLEALGLNAEKMRAEVKIFLLRGRTARPPVWYLPLTVGVGAHGVGVKEGRLIAACGDEETRRPRLGPVLCMKCLGTGAAVVAVRLTARAENW